MRVHRIARIAGHDCAPASGVHEHASERRCARLQGQVAIAIRLAVAPVKVTATGLPRGSAKDTAVISVPAAAWLERRTAIC